MATSELITSQVMPRPHPENVNPRKSSFRVIAGFSLLVALLSVSVDSQLRPEPNCMPERLPAWSATSPEPCWPRPR